MPYQPHVRVEATGLIGTMSAPREIFSYGISLQTFAAADLANAVTVANRLSTFHASSDAGIGSNAILTNVKYSEVGTDGKVIGTPFNIPFPLGVPGGRAAGDLPWQSSVVVSLFTGNRGARYKGRFYLPCPGVAVSSASGQINEGNYTSNLAAAAKSLCDDLNALPILGGVTVVVASSIVGNTPVTQVRVGSVIDTQRRRRNDLVETYSVADLA